MRRKRNPERANREIRSGRRRPSHVRVAARLSDPISAVMCYIDEPWHIEVRENAH
jgi:hypothetical protein